MNDNEGFMFLKTISDACNPFNLIVEDKLTKKLLAAKEPIHRSLAYSPSLNEINEDLKRYNAGVTLKSFWKGGDIQKALGSLPGWGKYSKEKHLPGHVFSGPGTNLEKRLNADDTPKADSIPINRVDLAAYHHDLAYRDNKDIESRHAADRKMIQELDAIENPSFRERVERMLVKKALQAKMFLGQGVGKNRFLLLNAITNSVAEIIS